MTPTFYRNKALSGNRGQSHVEFAAAHKEVALGIAANETALAVLEFCAAERTALPPVLFSGIARCSLARVRFAHAFFVMQ
jgi:hypothetical protein